MKKNFLLMLFVLVGGCDNAPEQMHQASEASQGDEASMMRDDHSPVIALMTSIMMKDSQQVQSIWSNMSDDHKDTARKEIENFLNEMPTDQQAAYSEIVKFIQ